ncbi:MAG: branched-chain amino acid aminotransferase [Erysipelotrichaceae bacterium]|nr:branched-chain amino acid aminotransferase [Erysipelotrichaceae bacterium]
MKIVYEEPVNEKVCLNEDDLGFGRIFADRMLEMDYTPEKGWHDPVISAYHPLSLNPECMVFHYAQEIFEGLKAYRCEDDSINLFRIDRNAKRFFDSAVRMAIPPIPETTFIELIKAYVDKTRAYVPYRFGNSLYIRPFIIATDNGLGVHASKNYRFVVISSPSGAYFKKGLDPVSIYVEDKQIRSAPGLPGFAKCGGNYAVSIKAGEMAKMKGYDQVLWLDGVEHRYIEEVGSMNIFFYIDRKLYTSACTGTVLPGVTRSSIIDICKEKGISVFEEKLSIDELVALLEKGKVMEIFGSGTAAVISPVGKIAYQDKEYIINDFKTGVLSKALFDEITGIQWGRIEDSHGWISRV